MSDKKDDHAGIITHPPFFYLASVAIALTVDYFFPLFIGYFNFTRPLAIILLVVALILIVLAGKMFRKDKQDISVHTTTQSIYQSGIYAITRNPLYLALTLLTAAGGLYFDKLWILIFLVPTIFLINKFVIEKEEAYLTTKFGNEYLDYKSKVRRWI